MITWQVGLAANLAIALASLAIAAIVGRALVRTRRWSENRVALITTAIVLAVGVGHLIQAGAVVVGSEQLAVRQGTGWTIVAWDLLTAAAVVSLLALRRQLPSLLQVSVTPEELDLRRGLDNSELELLYQPHLTLVNGRVAGFEALVRWRHPVRGTLPPSAFIPLAERSDLIDRIGRWVLSEACVTAVSWPDHGASRFVSVNLSATGLSRDDLLTDVSFALDSSGLPASRLVLEITEGAIVADSDRAVAVLGALRERGVRIAIDDFGTGYSGLAYLATLPLDTIKLAQEFVRDLERPRTATIVGSLLELARKLGLATVAEGVETEPQAQVLRELGCEMAQGFLFGRPIPRDEAARLVSGQPLVSL